MCTFTAVNKQSGIVGNDDALFGKSAYLLGPPSNITNE